MLSSSTWIQSKRDIAILENQQSGGPLTRCGISTILNGYATTTLLCIFFFLVVQKRRALDSLTKYEMFFFECEIFWFRRLLLLFIKYHRLVFCSHQYSLSYHYDFTIHGWNLSICHHTFLCLVLRAYLKVTACQPRYESVNERAKIGAHQRIVLIAEICHQIFGELWLGADI